MAAYFDTTWYVNSVGYAAVTTRPQNTAVAAGVLRRQFTAPTVGQERVFVCIIAGTTANTTDATWTVTRGAKVTDGTATWQECTGIAGLNGDATNMPTWTSMKAVNTPSLGVVIKRNNGASYQICSTAGTLGASEPAFSDTAGVTTTEGTTTWTSLGPVGNFTAGQAPHARLSAACAANWGATGNTIYVADNHAETQGSAISFTIIGGVSGATTKVLCHNHSGSYPPAASDIITGATITNTGTFNFSVLYSGAVYMYGLTFKAAVGGTTTTLALQGTGGGNLVWCYCDNCSFQVAGTSSCSISLSNTPIIWNNCTVSFNSTGSTVNLVNLGQFRWQNTGQVLAGGSTVPTTLLGSSITSVGYITVVLEGLDLSQITGNIYGAIAQNLAHFGNILIKDCKLNASATVGASVKNGCVVQFTRSDSTVAYKSARYTWEGTEITDIGIIRAGGATDPTGQVQSRRIVTTANPEFVRPFNAEPYAIWNSVTGSSVTVTLYGVYYPSLPNNDDIWMEVNYLGDASSPISTITTTTKDNVWDSNAAVSSDSSTWGSTSIGYNGTVSANVTVSANFLTVTQASIFASTGAASAVFHTTGKFYFEVMFVTTNGTSDCVGLLTDVANFTNFVNGTGGFTISKVVSGTIYANGAATGKSVGAISAGDVIGIAVDLTTRKGWARKNNGNWNGDATHNPATGAGGVTLHATVGFTPAVAFAGTGSAINDSFTANFGASAYANAAPAGFNNWGNLSDWFAFKLTKIITPQLPGYIDVRVRVAKTSTTFYIDPKVELS